MKSVIRYGQDASVELEIRREALAAHCAAPRGAPVNSVADATDRALADPLDFPPLAHAALPGDKVAIALAHGVPQAAKIVARAAEILVSSGVRAHDITIVQTLEDHQSGAPSPLNELSGATRETINLELHDPACRDALSYLAASTNAKPIYVNRSIHDADFVIAIGCLRLEDSLGYHGIGSSLFPTFSDTSNVARYNTAKASLAPRRDRLRKEAEEVVWLLGARFTIQVVPGAGTDVLHVLAGDMDAVLGTGAPLCTEAWSYRVPHKADLVVATIEGNAMQQTWDNVARALAAASLVEDANGDILLCTELASGLGPALQRIVGADDPDEALNEIDRCCPRDAVVAGQLVHALKRGKVYLVSQLDDELVEDLGISPVDREHIGRIVTRYDSCIVLGNAQHAMARAPGEMASKLRTVKRRSRR